MIRDTGPKRVTAFGTIRQLPLRTEFEIVKRVEGVLQRATMHELWLIPLDADRAEIGPIARVDVPRRPNLREHVGRSFAEFIDEMGAAVDAASVVWVLERTGDARLRSADREWIQHIEQVRRFATTEILGPVLLHDDGASWIGPTSDADASDSLAS